MTHTHTHTHRRTPWGQGREGSTRVPVCWSRPRREALPWGSPGVQSQGEGQRSEREGRAQGSHEGEEGVIR